MPLKLIVSLLLTVALTGCALGGGTHGSIKTYRYAVTKADLETAVNKVISNDTTIHRNFESSYYNDSKNYVKMKIRDTGEEYEYTWRYYGDSLLWATSGSSQLFICYIYDGKGNGGSEGNEKWDDTPKPVKKKMISAFETTFITKLDQELNQQRVEAK